MRGLTMIAALGAMSCSSGGKLATDAATTDARATDTTSAPDAPGGTDATTGADATVTDARTATGDATAGDMRQDGATVCVLGASYTFSTSHGINPNSETGRLTPPASFTYENRTLGIDAGNGSCTLALPACNTPGVIDVADLEADLANPDVQQAFAQTTPIIYGPRNLADADNFSVVRGDGRAFAQYDSACTPASANCVVTPPGIHQLVADLHALITQSLADPSCAGLH